MNKPTGPELQLHNAIIEYWGKLDLPKATRRKSITVVLPIIYWIETSEESVKEVVAKTINGMLEDYEVVAIGDVEYLYHVNYERTKYAHTWRFEVVSNNPLKLSDSLREHIKEAEVRKKELIERAEEEMKPLRETLKRAKEFVDRVNQE